MTTLLSSTGQAATTGQRFVSRARVAQMLGVTPSTVTRWAKLGLIPTRVTVGGHHRYYESDIQQLEVELAKGRLPATVQERAREVKQPTARRAEAPPREGIARSRSPKQPVSSIGLQDMVEIRWHGRGGQGVVTAGEILAEAALLENMYFQAFPEFGPERTGAPIRAFTRISKTPITLHCPISHPNIVMVMDPTLLTTVDVLEGLREDGTLIVNTPLDPAALKARISPSATWKVITVNATRIAMESFKRNVPNTPMLGALLRASPVVSKETCLRFLKERLGSRLAAPIVEANIKAFERAYAEAAVE
ncbi:MAG: 2-oxoacid:acceptor oxidoreductase family protein [Dehalococcoidia bacterium]|nr:2-oxoacid:acceptor oxidoreductase family protein [Dehalococcoidia bacterium]